MTKERGEEAVAVGANWKGQMANESEEQSELRFRDHESLRFLYGVCSKDQVHRAQSLDNISKIFDDWIEGYGSPKESVSENHHEENHLSTDLKPLIKEQMPDILRLSCQCPFTDVRDRCTGVLDDLQVNLL